MDNADKVKATVFDGQESSSDSSCDLPEPPKAPQNDLKKTSINLEEQQELEWMSAEDKILHFKSKLQEMEMSMSADKKRLKTIKVEKEWMEATAKKRKLVEQTSRADASLDDSKKNMQRKTVGMQSEHTAENEKKRAKQTILKDATSSQIGMISISKSGRLLKPPERWNQYVSWRDLVPRRVAESHDRSSNGPAPPQASTKDRPTIAKF